MEGSVAAGGQGQGAGGDAGGQGDAQQQQQVQQQSPAELLGFDPQALLGQLEQVQSGQEGLRELLQAQQQGGEEEADQGFDLSFLDPMSGLDPQQMGQQLQTLLRGEAERIADQRVQQIVQERIDPLVQRLDEGDRTQMLRDLTAEFPEIAEPEMAQQVVGLSTQIVQAYGWPQEMAADPRLWRLAYLAGRAADAHNEEEQGGADPVTALLEGGRGPMPGGGQGQVDLGEQIVNGGGRRGASVLPFG